MTVADAFRAPALRGPAAWLAAWLALSLGGLSGCGPIGLVRPEEPPLRISEIAGAGDAARRASTRLVLVGLDDDAEGRPDAAEVSYERALRVDATNPWAYLALARHRADGVDPASALPFLDRTQALLEAEGGVPPGAEVHLVGLRGAALRASGREDEGWPLVVEARRRAPEIWDDGRLAADELR